MGTLSCQGRNSQQAKSADGHMGNSSAAELRSRRRLLHTKIPVKVGRRLQEEADSKIRNGPHFVAK